MKKNFGNCLILGFIAISFCFTFFTDQASAKDKVHKWRFQTYAVPGSVGFKGFEKAIEDLKVATNGRIQIKLFGVGSLVGPFDQLDGVSKGIFEGAFNAGAYYAGKDPAFAAYFSLIGVWDKPSDVKVWAYHFGGNELISQLYSKYKVQYVGPALVGAEPIMSNVPLESLEDFKGIKIRASGGLSSELFTRLGASPVKMGGGDLYTGLDTKIVDAAEFVSLAENYDMGLHEVSKYVLYPSFHGPIAMCDVIVNQKKWDALPEDLKAIMKMWMYNVDANFDYMSDAESIKALQKMKEKGLVQTTLSSEDMKKAKDISLEIAHEWGQKSEMSGKIIDSILSFLRLKGTVE
jgi:TRAP-type mannitol/chloroaromatic compound transport system substrate-binding protein